MAWRLSCFRSADDTMVLDDSLISTTIMVMNKVVTLAQAKAHISALVTEAEAGSEITITRHGKPVARIIGAPTKKKRVAGDWGWTEPFDKSVLAAMTDEEMREKGWPV
jgi:prevent-host-death family protein